MQSLWGPRHKKVLVAFTGLDITIGEDSENALPQKLFMGFGYNPDIYLFGERLDILNFFSWMKRLQKTASTGWIVYDASAYCIVNRMPQKRVSALGEKPSAAQVLEVIVTEQDNPKREGIMEICDLRSAYLKRVIKITGVGAQYVDSREVFRDEKGYETALEMALDFFRKLGRDNPELVARLTPANPTLGSAFYPPLEIAEAFFLRERFGIGGKFGPETEEPFDTAIMQLAGIQRIPFAVLRCSSGPRKPGYLSDKNVIWTANSDERVLRILASDPAYRTFVSDYLQPFWRKGETEEELVLRMKRAIGVIE